MIDYTKLFRFVSIIYSAPLRIVVGRYGVRSTVDYESDRWRTSFNLGELDGLTSIARFSWLVAKVPEFRNLVHFRLKAAPVPLRVLLRQIYRGDPTLRLNAVSIGKGLVIQHGFASTINAESIGDDCWINQQVTIGWTTRGRPTIGDRVRIGAGAIIVGRVNVGNDAVIGVNATVIRDVAPGTTVVAPAAELLATNSREASPREGQDEGALSPNTIDAKSST